MTTRSFEQLTGAYADAARGALLADDPADTAQVFVARAAELTEACAARLASVSDADETRAMAGPQMLAKALVETVVAEHLIGVANAPEKAARASRAARSAAEVEPFLAIVGTGRIEVIARRAAADPASFAPVEVARGLLRTALADTCALISRRSAKSGQTALAGLAGLGLGTIAKAVDVVGSGLSFKLGDESAGSVYGRARDSLVSAYASIRALLGDTAAHAAGAQMKAWVDDLATGTLYADLLERWYRTAETRQKLAARIETVAPPSAQWAMAANGLDGLGRKHAGEADLVDKLLKGMKIVGLLPPAALPEATLLLGAAYVALGGYIVFAGADAVDAPVGLNRVAGIRIIVEQALVK